MKPAGNPSASLHQFQVVAARFRVLDHFDLQGGGRFVRVFHVDERSQGLAGLGVVKGENHYLVPPGRRPFPGRRYGQLVIALSVDGAVRLMLGLVSLRCVRPEGHRTGRHRLAVHRDLPGDGRQVLTAPGVAPHREDGPPGQQGCQVPTRSSDRESHGPSPRKREKDTWGPYGNAQSPPWSTAPCLPKQAGHGRFTTSPPWWVPRARYVPRGIESLMKRIEPSPNRN